MAERKYQVFISSTYKDLIDERNAVTQCLLDNDCIPVGMEQFPASNMTQMDYIKKMLDDCDYYILILAGKYGSIDNDGVGYTEKEYDYAISKGIPVLSFVIKDLEKLRLSQCESDPHRRKKLENFRKKVCEGKLVRFYSNADDLKGHVSLSIYKAIRDFPAIGWIRGTKKADTADDSVTDEITSIKNNMIKKDILTEEMFIWLIDSINYREWLDAVKNADFLFKDEHYGGIFYFCDEMIDGIKKEDEIDEEALDSFTRSLLIYKALYNIAATKSFYSFCDFLNSIKAELYTLAGRDLTQYTAKNVELLIETRLVSTCLEKLKWCKKYGSGKNDSELNNYKFWEKCVRVIYELHRMIELYNQAHN